MMNPAHHLPAAADRPADEQLERRQHLPQCPASRSSTTPIRSSTSRTPCARPAARFLPSDAELGEKIIAGRAALVEGLVAVRAVPADGRSVDQHLRGAGCRAQVAAPAPARYAPCSERGYRAGVA